MTDVSETDSSGYKRSWQLLVAAAAAFGAYFCMYAFRKPFTAATYEGMEISGLGLKTVLVVSQLLGYMLSKFIGIRVISEMPARFRAVSIIVLIGIAELALVGFAYAPVPLKIVMIFLNGLPLGMIFGLVLAYLEGRRQTEALSAALCASFIISSGVVKSVGRWLMESWQVDQFVMPMMTGLFFLPPLLISVWLLQATPVPDDQDRHLRAERKALNRDQRRDFLKAYWPGLFLLIFVYIAITVIRTIRDDFGVEIWRDLGITETPSIFARSETVVALFVTALNALAIWIKGNRLAIRITLLAMIASFAMIMGSTLVLDAGWLTPFAFMVTCGVGLYVPYVAFHTTFFERIIAASRHPGNLGFLMYLADSMGYLGYALVMFLRTSFLQPKEVLPFFTYSLWTVSILSIIALFSALYYFNWAFSREKETVHEQALELV